MARSVDVRLLAGQLSHWTRPTDTGRSLTCYFCPDCGSRVWHGDKDREDEISIKGGSLDEPVDLTEAIHIWTGRKLRGVIIPAGNRQYSGEPDETGLA
jgi:hypothetical protein